MMTPFNNWTEYQAERERVEAIFLAYRPSIGDDSFTVWLATRRAAMRDLLHRMRAKYEYYDRYWCENNDQTMPDGYVPERLAA